MKVNVLPETSSLNSTDSISLIHDICPMHRTVASASLIRRHPHPPHSHYRIDGHREHSTVVLMQSLCLNLRSGRRLPWQLDCFSFNETKTSLPFSCRCLSLKSKICQQLFILIETDFLIYLSAMLWRADYALSTSCDSKRHNCEATSDMSAFLSSSVHCSIRHVRRKTLFGVYALEMMHWF